MLPSLEVVVVEVVVMEVVVMEVVVVEMHRRSDETEGTSSS